MGNGDEPYEEDYSYNDGEEAYLEKEAVAQGYENGNQYQIALAAKRILDRLQNGKNWGAIQDDADVIRVLAWEEQGFPPFGGDDEF